MSLINAKLNIVDSQGSSAEFLINSNSVSIGQAPENILHLDYPDVSLYHACINTLDNEFTITDLGSGLSTKVNSEVIPPHTSKVIKNGDSIQIGSLDIRFLCSQETSKNGNSTQLAEVCLPIQLISAENKTVLKKPTNTPTLHITTPHWEKSYTLKKPAISIGRDPASDIVIDIPTVSAKHAKLNFNKDHYEIIDLGSRNKLIYEGSEITSKQLNNGDVIWIGFDITLTYGTTLSMDSISTPMKLLDLKGMESITIGRDSRNNNVIDHPSVSRFHARIDRKNGSLILTDLKSSNGTFVNGKEIDGEHTLRSGDVIQVSSFRFVLNADETVTRYNDFGNMRLDAVHLTKVVGKGVTLLDDISLSIFAKDFVVIAGVSGGGKSTLLDALNGFRPATGGSVLINNNDLYKNFNAYRTELGYVPQKDIVHLELTVEQALDYAAQMRMPSDTTKVERKQRIDQVMAQMGLSDRRHVEIKALSGGQLKRVSIGVELITKPTLFFLDEATSGLDPGTERKVMQLLRQLADEGRTVFLITHATENISLCDQVIFLAKGGKVAYFGKPQDAPNFFGVSSFTEIYGKVEDEKSPNEWQDIYKQSLQYKKVIAQQRDLEINQSTKHNSVVQQSPLGSKSKQISGWRQFLILSNRNFAILMRDRASLILMLAIAPILGLLDFVTWKRNIFNIETGDPGQAVTMLFTTGLISVMVGSLATMREIVKEVDIYRRERMIGLMIIPYILSKVAFCVVLALYQAAIFLLFKHLAVDIPGDPVIMYVTLFLGTMAGMMMGLLVSAISPNQNMAPLLTIIFLVPQIIFGGGILPIHEFGAPGKLINQVSLTKWPFEALVTITKLGDKVASDRCWQVDETERKEYSDDYKENNCTCLGAKVFERCEFPGLKSKYDQEAQEAVESLEPEKPKSPGSVPKDPFQLKDYEKQVNQYNDQIKVWQTEFSDWKGKRESAIARAEGLINRFNTDYGSMFKVEVIKHWTFLSGLILAMFTALIVVQKRKDVI